MGSSPMSTLATPTVTIVTASMLRRPARSPSRPRTIAPSGRHTNPTAYDANVTSSETVGSFEGKNSRPITAAIDA
ncbi:hypothetical protein STAL104432_23630 [Streptomyces albus]